MVNHLQQSLYTLAFQSSNTKNLKQKQKMEKISTLDLSAITDTTQEVTAMNHWFSPETGIYNSKHKPIQLPKTQYLDLVSFIFSHKHDGVSALIDSQSGFQISYTELQQMVKSMASGLHEIGICRGDVVLLLLPNTVFFPVIFLGILSIGAVATTMNPLSSFSEISKQISGSNVAMVFTVHEKLKEIENLGVRVVEVPVRLDSYSSSSDFSSFDKILLSNPDLAPMPVIDQQDTAAILYSSGTSGASKGVVLSHSNLIAVVEHFVRFEAFQYENLPSSKNVYLDVLPMFHCYGLSLFAMGLLSLGSTVVVMRKFDLVELVRAINRYNVTHLPVVPPILMALTKVKALGNCELRSLKQVSCGAAPVTKKAIRDFIQSFPHVDFIQGYGMTESAAVGTRGFNTDYIRKYTSVGLLAPNMQAKVVDWNTGSCMPPGNSGELMLRGPGIMKGYLNNEDATRSTVDKDGWLHTGDIAHFDYDGYLYILDRLKDTIKYKGFQISPADLEAVLISHPEILDVAVTAARNDEVGEVPVAFVVRRDGSEVTQADVINYVAAQVSPYKKVRKVVFTQSIPKSAAGKVLRRQLRDSLVSKI